jgi:threonine-phosphate decarboxylase
MKHGANIYKYAKKLNCNANEIIDFSSNINLYHPNINITPTSKMLVKYADNSYKSLKKAIANRYNIKKKQMALYNGATSAIFELFRHLKSKRVYLYAPLYGEYEKAIDTNVDVCKINRFKELYKDVKKNSTVVFVNPATPDGKFYKLDKLFDYWKQQNCTIVLDESFIEFENLKYLKTQINLYKKLYIIQSFSKFYSCAGIRIGAIFSHKDNIKELKFPMWGLSSFDSEFLTKRLSDKHFAKKTKILHKKQKKELYNILKDSKLFSKIYKSKSNFFLTKSEKSKIIFKELLEKKILIRTCGSFDFLGNKHLRFAVKDKHSHNILIKALKEIKK